MSVTIKDIANVAGVSYSTVSKALNDSPLVKTDTKKRIVEVAKEMGYEPNFAAQRLVSKQTKTIGLIWPTIERVVLSTLVTKISNEINKTPYSMILSVDPVEASLETFKRFQVDGIILFEESNSEIIGKTSIPILTYGVAENKSLQSPVIDANQKQAMADAVNYLYKLGHTDIAYIGDLTSGDPMQMEKVNGFKNAIRELGLPSKADNIINTAGLDWYDGYRAVTMLLNNTKRPTAIIGGSYDISGGIIRGIKEKNLNIPTDISVISYDNIPQMATMEIPLTCIGVPVEKLAAEIVSSIIKLVEDNDIQPYVKKMLPELNERASCSKISKPKQYNPWLD